jgi:hypothetical protein
MRNVWAILLLVLLGLQQSALAQDPCNCKGYSGPGGPCYAGPGGPAYDGPGGPAYRGPGGRAIPVLEARATQGPVDRHTKVTVVRYIVGPGVQHMMVPAALRTQGPGARAMPDQADPAIQALVELAAVVRPSADKAPASRCHLTARC